jgi:hypothetical protein
MQTRRMLLPTMLVVCLGLAWLQVASAADEPLPSWQDGPARRAIIDFVARITREGGPDFVPPAERIATFDNDGTLWTEQPMYIQMAFALNRVKAFAPQHPEWRDQQPFKAVLEGDLKALAASGEKGLVELLAYLRANGFKTYIVSGGGIESIRPWTEKANGIPPAQVIGSSIKTKFEMRDGMSAVVHQRRHAPCHPSSERVYSPSRKCQSKQ